MNKKTPLGMSILCIIIGIIIIFYTAYTLMFGLDAYKASFGRYIVEDLIIGLVFASICGVILIIFGLIELVRARRK